MQAVPQQEDPVEPSRRADLGLAAMRLGATVVRLRLKLSVRLLNLGRTFIYFHAALQTDLQS